MTDGKADDITVIHGDCREVMASMPAGSVDAVVTDPPYGTGEWQRPEPGLGRKPKAAFSKAAWDVWETAWIDEARRICSGPVVFFLPVKELASGVNYAASTGEPWRLMTWCKSDPMPMFTRQVAYGFESVIVLRSHLVFGGKDWCEASSPRAGRDRAWTGHPHQKPLKVMRWLCEMVPGVLILDPFAGSGTTLVACLKVGRRGIGIESEKKYIPVIDRRVAEARTPMFGHVAAGQTSMFGDGA